MEIQNNQKHLEIMNHSKNGWSREEKAKIATMVLPLIETQKSYGKEINPKMILTGWEIALAEKYTAEQVCKGLIKYVRDIGSDFPTPKNIRDAIESERPKSGAHLL